MGTLEQQIDAYQTQSSSSSSSSIDSNNYPSSLCLSTLCRKRTDNLSTDLRLGLSISPPSSSHQSQLPFISTTPRYIYMYIYIHHLWYHNCNNINILMLCFFLREEAFDWPPIKSTLRTTLVEKQSNFQSQKPSLFVKVYMEGIPIGRKLNLLAHHSYDGLVKALCHMFRTIILCKHIQINLHNKHFLLLDLITIY